MNKKNLIVLICLLQVMIAKSQRVEWFSSSEDTRWKKEKTLKPEAGKPGSESEEIVISDEKAQYIEGFGACFNELGWDALMTLPEKERLAIIEELFSPSGSNYNFCRMSIGANDYSLSYYSLNDVEDDFKMINFNIARDRYILIPYIKTAMKYNPSLRIWASPWTPPAWMKTNHHYAGNYFEEGRIDYNGLPREKIAELPTTAFKMQRGYLEAYALYFTKFVRAYEKEGIPIEAIHIQNEPCSNHVFPSCNWRPEDMAYFIGEFLGPKFQEENVSTDIYFGTINRDNPEFTRAALRDQKAFQYIKGVGFQWDGKWAVPHIHKEYPELKIMQTESECGNGENNWGSAEYTWGLISHYLRNGASTYAYWNMVLDDTGMSTWGWKQNALISINRESGKVTYNPEYYVMKHLSHYVQPGAYRLQASEGDNHLAFENPDGKVIVILANRQDTDKVVHVKVRDQEVSVPMKAHSFHTLSFDFSKLTLGKETN